MPLKWPTKASELHPALAGAESISGDSRIGSSLSGCSIRVQDPTTLLAAAISEITKANSLQDPFNKAKHVRAAAMLSHLAIDCLPEIEVWTCASMYDPRGSFRPGDITVWSGHFEKDEAERWLAAWKAKLTRGGDIWQPIERRPCSLSDIIVPGYKNLPKKD